MPTNDQVKQSVNDLLNQATTDDEKIEIANTIATTVYWQIVEIDDAEDVLSDLGLTICGD